MLKEREALIRRILISVDALIVAGVFLLTYELRRHIHDIYKLDLIPSIRVIPRFAPSLSDYLVVAFLAIILWCVMLYLNGMYRSLRLKSLLEVSWIIIKSAFLVVLVFGALVFLFKLKFVSRIFFLGFTALSSLALLIEKMVIFRVMHRVRTRGYNYRKLLIVGTGRRAADFIQKLNNHPEWGVKIEGVLDFESERVGKDFEGNEVIGTLWDIPNILHTRPIDEVVFVVPRSRLNDIENYLYVCQTEGVKTTLAVDFFEIKLSHLRQTELDGIPLITFETTFAKEWQLFIKRALDIIVSGTGIALLFPLFLIVAILIKLTSPGPVFFLQKRIGLNGRKFVLYKFRTMYLGAQRKQRQLQELNIMQGPVFKVKNDPRVTAVGKFLRIFSIDELLQLVNVFLGHMSLVGPRPPIPREVKKYEPWQRRRLSMRPGITCLWQISGRNKIDFNEWMKLDLAYLDNWSLWLDFKILLKTIPAVLSSKGAY